MSASDAEAYCPRCAGRLLLDTDRAGDAVGEPPGSRNSFRLGEYELAMENLEKAFAEGDPLAIYMNQWPMLDPLRENPRFQALLAKMNLWP